MILYRTAEALFVKHEDHAYPLEETSLDALIARPDLHIYLIAAINTTPPADHLLHTPLLAPIGSQEVWASGVTYYSSRRARIAESKDAGGGDFYDRVYTAQRPELFFKAVAHKVAGPNSHVKIRRDATWSVPEPELTLFINPRAEIIGYTIGNDMSSRDIEGTNPLYLPQAKVYDRSCALGPGILIRNEPMPTTTQIQLDILRAGHTEFSGATTLAELKRDPVTLVEYLFRDQTFPYGCFLLTGTGIVPPDSFTLQSNDEIQITIDGIGTLINTVE
ncbi:MAG TPA: fumarylacetoacetate hydrolase family protein [Edaphobacter sp.]|nr:fumarylacetoacetate hydrolase family protein [Edaphobacter sp.]